MTVFNVGKGKSMGKVVNYIFTALAERARTEAYSGTFRAGLLEDASSLGPNGVDLQSQMLVLNMPIGQVCETIRLFEASEMRKPGGKYANIIVPVTGRDDGVIAVHPEFSRGNVESFAKSGDTIQVNQSLFVGPEWNMGRDAFDNQTPGQKAIFNLFGPRDLVDVRPVGSGDRMGALVKIILTGPLSRASLVKGTIKDMIASGGVVLPFCSAFSLSRLVVDSFILDRIPICQSARASRPVSSGAENQKLKAKSMQIQHQENSRLNSLEDQSLGQAS